MRWIEPDLVKAKDQLIERIAHMKKEISVFKSSGDANISFGARVYLIDLESELRGTHKKLEDFDEVSHFDRGILEQESGKFEVYFAGELVACVSSEYEAWAELKRHDEKALEALDWLREAADERLSVTLQRIKKIRSAKD
jgi:hypothetical protein